MSNKFDMAQSASQAPTLSPIRKARADALVAFVREYYLAPVAGFGSLISQLLKDKPMKGNWTRREIIQAVEDLVSTNRACVTADERPGTLCVIVPEAAKVDRGFWAGYLTKNGEGHAVN